MNLQKFAHSLTRPSWCKLRLDQSNDTSKLVCNSMMKLIVYIHYINVRKGWTLLYENKWSISISSAGIFFKGDDKWLKYCNIKLMEIACNVLLWQCTTKISYKILEFSFWRGLRLSIDSWFKTCKGNSANHNAWFQLKSNIGIFLACNGFQKRIQINFFCVGALSSVGNCINKKNIAAFNIIWW